MKHPHRFARELLADQLKPISKIIKTNSPKSVQNNSYKDIDILIYKGYIIGMR